MLPNAVGRTLRTEHGGLGTEIVVPVKCSTLQEGPMCSATAGPTQDNRSGENQATAADASASPGAGRPRPVGLGRKSWTWRGVTDLTVSGLSEASGWQPSGIGPPPPLGNGRLRMNWCNS